VEHAKCEFKGEAFVYTFLRLVFRVDLDAADFVAHSAQVWQRSSFSENKKDRVFL
jgi:hypothetical protein